MKTHKQTLSDRVRAAIAADGRSISEIARRAGLAQPTLSRFASGTRDLTGERLGRLLPVLGIELVDRPRSRRK